MAINPEPEIFACVTDESLNGHNVTQANHHITYRQEYRRCGNSCCKDEPTHGPYWYGYWREGDRVRSKYIGKKFKELEVRVWDG